MRSAAHEELPSNKFTSRHSHQTLAPRACHTSLDGSEKHAGWLRRKFSSLYQNITGTSSPVQHSMELSKSGCVDACKILIFLSSRSFVSTWHGFDAGDYASNGQSASAMSAPDGRGATVMHGPWERAVHADGIRFEEDHVHSNIHENPSRQICAA
jgi:hypothetical protein